MASYVNQFWGPGKYTVLADSNILDWSFTSGILKEKMKPLHAINFYYSAVGKADNFVKVSDVEKVDITQVIPSSHKRIDMFGSIDGLLEGYIIYGDCTNRRRGYFSMIESGPFDEKEDMIVFASTRGNECDQLNVMYQPGPNSSVQIDVEFVGHSPGRVLRALANAYEKRLSEHKSASMVKEDKKQENVPFQGQHIRG